MNIARVVTRGATGYTTTDLPVPNGATSCVVLAINDQLQAVGTCLYPKSATNVPKTAFWNTPTSSPNLLTLPLNAQNSAVALNNNGHVLAFSADIQGTAQLLYWEDTTSSFGVQPINPPQGAVQLNFVGFADNDRVALNSVDTDQYSTSCTWDPVNGAAGIVCLLPINGGKKSKLTSISTDGKYAAGININADQDAAAVRVTLP